MYKAEKKNANVLLAAFLPRKPTAHIAVTLSNRTWEGDNNVLKI